MDWVFARLRVPAMQENETLIGFEPVTRRRAGGWWETEHSGTAVWPERTRESDGQSTADEPVDLQAGANGSRAVAAWPWW